MEEQISVIMSVYNTDIEHLSLAVESILNQTLEDFEFIIINDASTTQVEDVLLKFEDRRIKYYKNQENIGLTKSLNKAIGLSKGKYIARMDADDYSERNRLKTQFDFLEANQAIGVLGTNGKSMGSSSKKLKMFKHHDDIKAQLIVNNPMIHPSIMIRAEILKQYLYNEDYRVAQDYELWKRIIDNTKFANLSITSLRYRIHEGQISSNRSLKQDDKIKDMRSDVLKRIYPSINTEEVDLFSKSATNQVLTYTEIIKLRYISDKIILENEVSKYCNEKSLSKVISINFDRALYIHSKKYKKLPFLRISILKKHNFNRFSFQKYLGRFL